jgi:hypothetical protein
MALDVEVGNFNKSTGASGSTDTITTSFEPKALIIWGMNGQTSPGESGGDLILGYGYSDGVNDRCIATRSADAQSKGSSENGARNDAAIGFIDPAGSGFTSYGTITFNATPNFQVTWTVNEAIATEINWIIFGGADITGVQVGDFASPASTGTQNIPTDADVRGITDGNGVLLVGSVLETSMNSTLRS